MRCSPVGYATRVFKRPPPSMLASPAMGTTWFWPNAALMAGIQFGRHRLPVVKVAAVGH
jgi:hypothetical protein